MLAPIKPEVGFYNNVKFFETLRSQPFFSKAQVRAMKAKQPPPPQGTRERERRKLKIALGKVNKSECSPEALEAWGSFVVDNQKECST